MDDNMFDRPQDDAPSAGDQEGGEEQSQEQSGQPQLINLEVWPDAKPGETKMFKCVKRMDKEIEVVAIEGDEHEDAPSDEPEMAGGVDDGGGMGSSLME